MGASFKTRLGLTVLTSLTSLAAALVAAPAASAQEAEAVPAQEATMPGEILVMARKRQESILEVPVVVTAISEEKLTNTGVTAVTELPKLVPGLVIGGNILSIGPQITIRGVGTSSSDPGVDQSVSLNIDGLSLGQGLAFGSALFDVGQVEVLKGPQALFFGKSSPGGVVSLRTADPTDEFELIARAGYEFVGREGRGELIISGPLSKSLRARLAGVYSRGEGYFFNRANPTPGTGGMAPTDLRQPQPRNFGLRGTLVFEPSESFSARLKINHVYDHAINAEMKQLSNCPDGYKSFGAFGVFPPVQFIAQDNCRFDRDASHSFFDPASFPGITNGGVPYLENKQDYGTLEMNFSPTPELTLTSVTAYYKLNSSSSANPSSSTSAGPAFAVTNRFKREQFTQELRLNSDFKGPLNFTLGGFYEDGQLFDRVRFIRNTSYVFLSPAVLGFDLLNDDRSTTVDIKTYSLFGQLRYDLTDQLEIAGGVRWTDETRQSSVYDYQNNVDLTPFLPRPRVHSSTLSPEATITYKPTDDLTVFGSYKRGFKSGSFAVAVPAAAIRNQLTGQIIGAEDKSFNDEKVSGYEIGVKSRLFDRQMIANIAFYDYRYQGLQVGAIEAFTNGVPVIRTVNAGRARTYGVDFDMSYRPRAIEGLTLTASVNWNKARYQDLNNIPCYTNQTFAQGCNSLFLPSLDQANPGVGALTVNGVNGFYTAQNLSNTQMIRAPEWAANFGFDYEFGIGRGMKLLIANNNQYSSEYPSYLAVNRPNRDNIQRSYFRIDASIALKGENDRWEVALLGKNLTDKLVGSNCAATNATGAGLLPFGGSISGGASQGPFGTAEALCYPDGPGRQIMLRLTLRPFN